MVPFTGVGCYIWKFPQCCFNGFSGRRDWAGLCLHLDLQGYVCFFNSFIEFNIFCFWLWQNTCDINFILAIWSVQLGSIKYIPPVMRPISRTLLLYKTSTLRLLSSYFPSYPPLRPWIPPFHFLCYEFDCSRALMWVELDGICLFVTGSCHSTRHSRFTLVVCVRFDFPSF